MKLKRSWAKFVCIMLTFSGISLLLGSVIPYDRIGPDTVINEIYHQIYHLKSALQICGISVLVSGVVQWNKHLRCIYCGRRAAMLWQKAGKRRYCNRCGKPLEFDDEI